MKSVKGQEAAAVWMPISNVAPWGDNPVSHPPEQVAEVVDSIHAYGWGRPILLHKATGKLIGGHCARLAMLSLMDDNGGSYVLPGAPGPNVVPVRVMDVSEKQAHGLALYDNRAGRLRVMDERAVARLLDGLMDDGLPLGYADDEALGLLALLQEPEVFTPPLPPLVQETAPYGAQGAPGSEARATSGVRLFQLFLDDKTHPQFVADATWLQEHWESDDLTAAIIKAVHECAEATKG